MHCLICLIVAIRLDLCFTDEETEASEKLRGSDSVTQLSQVESWDPDPKFVLSASFPSLLEPLDFTSCSPALGSWIEP